MAERPAFFARQGKIASQMYSLLRLMLEEYGRLPGLSADEFIEYHKGHMAG